MAGQTSGRTTRPAGRDRTTVDTTSEPVTGATTGDATTGQTPRDVPSRPTLPDRSPRTGVGVSVPTVRAAFASGDASQSVGYIQHVLRARGFEPGNVSGIADHATRVALAKFQQSIGEPATGLPTDRDVDYLGFDIVG